MMALADVLTRLVLSTCAAAGYRLSATAARIPAGFGA